MATSDPILSTDDPGLNRLSAEHPELAETLRTQAGCAECTVQMSLLPLHSRRFLWQLYRKHYPDLASWLEEFRRDGSALNEGATLSLRAIDILRAVRDESNTSR
jgi:hypothetical protein